MKWLGEKSAKCCAWNAWSERFNSCNCLSGITQSNAVERSHDELFDMSSHVRLVTTLDTVVYRRTSLISFKVSAKQWKDLYMPTAREHRISGPRMILYYKYLQVQSGDWTGLFATRTDQQQHRPHRTAKTNAQTPNNSIGTEILGQLSICACPVCEGASRSQQLGPKCRLSDCGDCSQCLPTGYS